MNKYLIVVLYESNKNIKLPLTYGHVTLPFH